MTDAELAAQLQQYIGRRVRITSNLRGGGAPIQWHDGTWPLITSVTETDNGVWCHSDDGVSWLVVAGELKIELEPVRGTYDFAQAADQMEAIATALRRYGPTPVQKRKRCACPACRTTYDKLDAAQEAEFVEIERARDAIDPPPEPAPEPAPAEPEKPEQEEGGLFTSW